MNDPGYWSLASDQKSVDIMIDGRTFATLQGRSLLAALLLDGLPGNAADFFCAIGQCQRCVVQVDGRPRLACLTYPGGGENVITKSGDLRPPPWAI
jgi:aerobic-type carbon monoxide dehydrogenase small subunit (CoxS/CutS family)